MNNPSTPIARRLGQVEIGYQADNQNITRRSLHQPSRQTQHTRRWQQYRPRPTPLLDLELATKLFGPVDFVTGLPTGFLEGRR
jgi:hypothetical protein